MALYKCHECGTEISTEAKSCPKCGAKTTSKTGCGTLVLIGIVAAAILSVMFGGGSNPSPYTASSEDAAAACRTAIELVLNDPDSAQFDPPAGATQNADSTWTAQRTLRAKNAFGAYRRAVYECNLMPNGDGTWRGLDVAEIS